MITYQNPVLPGFHPDPTIARVGDDYYLATSSFEYYPGVPLFHSRNLVQWTPIGHALTRRSQVDLRGSASSDGIYAPTLRYHAGMFYLITTDVRGIGNFYVSAADPAGPWSDPITLPHGGIDPSLFFDDDGKVYVTVQNGFGYDSHIIQYRIEIATGEVLSEPVVVWEGDEGPWMEGPHLYKMYGYYYLICASGGTGSQHRQLVARSRNPFGPYEQRPEPMLTHSGMAEHPIQCTGHADIFQDGQGDWWAVFLGTRPVEGRYAVLGRETFLAPVRWTADGWPHIDNNEGAVDLTVRVPRLPGPLSENQASPQGEPFGSVLDPRWSFLRDHTAAQRYSLSARPGWLQLTGSEYTLSDEGPALFVGIRQRDICMQVSCRLEFNPVADSDFAGLAIRLNHRGYVAWGLAGREDGGRCLRLTAADGDERLVQQYPIEDGSVCLRIGSDGQHYRFAYSAAGSDWLDIETTVPAEWLSPERNGGFTGVLAGMFAVSEAQTAAYATEFRYGRPGELL